jgi:hypothetical protein
MRIRETPLLHGADAVRIKMWIVKVLRRLRVGTRPASLVSALGEEPTVQSCGITFHSGPAISAACSASS